MTRLPFSGPIHLGPLLLLLLWGCCITPSWGAGGAALADGAPFPLMDLPAPDSAADLDYLNLRRPESDSKKPVSVPNIGADIVIIEIFSLYCPFCQVAAPAVNDIFDLLARSPELGAHVKLIGIGVGNSAYEVDFFKKKYNIQFPLFPDPDFEIYQCLNNPRTPYFICVKNFPNGSSKIVHTHLGGIQNPQKFIDTVLDAAGPEKGDKP